MLFRSVLGKIVTADSSQTLVWPTQKRKAHDSPGGAMEAVGYSTPPPPVTRAPSASDFMDPDEVIISPEVKTKLPPLSALEHGAWAVQGRDGRRYHDTSLLCLQPSSWPRKWCIYLVESRFFEPCVLSVIILNVTTMAMQSPLDEGGTVKAAFISVRTSPCTHAPTRQHACQLSCRRSFAHPPIPIARA